MTRPVYGILLFIALFLAACSFPPRVISRFADTLDAEGRPRGGPHAGVDVHGHPGHPVLAAADGKVQEVGEEQRYSAAEASCGKYVVIQHEHPVSSGGSLADTRYCHLREYRVAASDTVKRGQIIGSTRARRRRSSAGENRT
jgi:murein DD-endopeptidase MepM/ murein hydrolase activator NlpD